MNFFNNYILYLVLVIVSFSLPKNIILSFAKDLHQYNMDDSKKILIAKIRFLLIECVAIMLHTYFGKFSLKTMVVPTLIIFFITPKFFLKGKHKKSN